MSWSPLFHLNIIATTYSGQQYSVVNIVVSERGTIAVDKALKSFGHTVCVNEGKQAELNGKHGLCSGSENSILLDIVSKAWKWNKSSRTIVVEGALVSPAKDGDHRELHDDGGLKVAGIVHAIFEIRQECHKVSRGG